MKTNFAYLDIVAALRQGCRHVPYNWYEVIYSTETIWHALNDCTPARHRVPFYSDPRDNVPPAGYVVMAVYGDIVGIVTERQYRRALKNEYVNQTCGIWYAANFPVFIQRSDGSLYLPRDPEHDN